MYSTSPQPLCVAQRRGLGPFIQSPQPEPSKPHKETFVPRLVEWSLVLEVVKEIQGG